MAPSLARFVAKFATTLRELIVIFAERIFLNWFDSWSYLYNGTESG